MLLCSQGLGGFDADAGPESEQPVAQVHIPLHGPGRQVELHRVGVTGRGGIGLEHVGSLGMEPPAIAAPGAGETRALQRVTLLALTNERKGPILAAEAQGDQMAGGNAGRDLADRQLQYQIMAEINAAAVV